VVAMYLEYNKSLISNAKELRKNMTAQERKLWYCFLKNYPVRIIRQRVIDNYIADFYCSNAKLVIEIDGSQHFSTDGLENDKFRTEKLESYNLYVIRFTNKDINENFVGVCEYIDNTIKKIFG
jgi:very-short-patch-repair endonuclease